jgi:hypothetical protein
MKTLQVPMKLEGIDGNAFAILGAFITAAKKAGYYEEDYNPVIEEATSGDYDHLLQTIIANTVTLEEITED